MPSLSSEFYPQLPKHYEHVFDDWVAVQEEERARERAAREEEERWARLCAEEEGDGDLRTSGCTRKRPEPDRQA